MNNKEATELYQKQMLNLCEDKISEVCGIPSKLLGVTEKQKSKKIMSKLRNIPNIKELNKKERYLAYDALANEFETFETIEEARDFIYESIKEAGCEDGIPDDVFHSTIYELKERIELETIAEREDYDQEDWEAEGYGDFEYIVNPKFKKVKRNLIWT